MQVKQNIPTILRLLSFVVITALVCTLLAGLNLTSFASGSGNDYGETPHGSGGVAEKEWGVWFSNGWGARVTLVYADTGNKVDDLRTVDYTYFTGVTSSDVVGYTSDGTAIAIPIENYYSLGGSCKTDYTNGQSLYFNKGYYAKTPPTVTVEGKTMKMPRLLNSNTSSSASEDRKKYFTSTDFLESFASDLGIDYSEVTSGKYKLLYEPIAYVNYPEYDYGLAGTVTEFAIFDLTSEKFDFTNKQKNYFVNKWSYQWLCYYWAISLGLEREEWGKFPAYTNVAKDKSNINIGTSDKPNYVTGFKQQTIRDKLGLATVTFTDEPTPPPSTIKVYYHLYNSSDVQTSLKTSTFDLGTSTTKQFTPSTAYGTPVAACVENIFATNRVKKVK